MPCPAWLLNTWEVPLILPSALLSMGLSERAFLVSWLHVVISSQIAWSITAECSAFCDGKVTSLGLFHHIQTHKNRNQCLPSQMALMQLLPRVGRIQTGCMHLHGPGQPTMGSWAVANALHVLKHQPISFPSPRLHLGNHHFPPCLLTKYIIS